MRTPVNVREYVDNTQLVPKDFNGGFLVFSFAFLFFFCNYVLTETPIHFGLNLCECQIRAADPKFL